MKFGVHAPILALILLLGTSCGGQDVEVPDDRPRESSGQPVGEGGDGATGKRATVDTDSAGAGMGPADAPELPDPEFLAQFLGGGAPDAIPEAEFERVRRIFAGDTGVESDRLEAFLQEADLSRAVVAQVFAAVLGSDAEVEILALALDRLGEHHLDVPDASWKYLRAPLLALIEGEDERLAADAIPVVCIRGGDEVEAKIAELVKGESGLRRLRSIRWTWTFDLRELTPEMEAIAVSGADREQLMAIQVLAHWKTEGAREIFADLRDDPEENSVIKQFAESALAKLDGGEFFVPANMGGAKRPSHLGRKPSPEE